MKKMLCLLSVMFICFFMSACGTFPFQPSDKQSSNDKVSKQNNILTAEELEAQLSEQELKIISTAYAVQDERYKALYPDMLQVILQNDTQYDIKSAVIAFAAWDKNNLPVKIKGSIDFSDGAYIVKVNYSDINLIPGDTFGDSYGFNVDESCNIDSFKAIVVSYEAFSGEAWNNPLYRAWCKLYEGVKLPSAE